jgi:hypothetical protein
MQSKSLIIRGYAWAAGFLVYGGFANVRSATGNRGKRV